MTAAANQPAGWNSAMSAPRRPGMGTSATPNLAGSGPGGTAATPAEHAQFADAVGAGSVKKPTAHSDDVVTGNTAEECINQWRERAKADMKKGGLDAEIERTKKENTPAAQAKAQDDFNAADKKLNDAIAAKNAAAPAPGSPEATRADAAISAARLRRSEADEANRRTQNAATRLPCLERMQANLAGPNPRPDGRTFVT